MKTLTNLILCLFVLSMIACKNQSGDQLNDTEIQEVVRLDSVSNVLDQTTDEIESKTKELDDLLNDL